MKEAELAALLVDAGLRWCAADGADGTLPVAAAWLATSCRREDGRRDETVRRDDPRLIGKANDGWFRLVSDYGFLGDDREFLLGVNHADDDAVPILRWARVRLLGEWDIIGAGAATGVLGSAAGRPEFAMLSLDGDVILRGTTWQESIGSLVVPDPHRVQIIRDYVARRSANPRTPAAERAGGESWLRTHPTEQVPEPE
ncbi:hypothetical protein [Streptomyces shenzhenensis]|uniref:hypothetical protein n=1 Tax=Streptomyces shenzhenensis TaxID=943815 RepID=UPI001F2D05FB|nr:hypothetical protein [Streptomyces shenzhenensis]